MTKIRWGRMKDGTEDMTEREISIEEAEEDTENRDKEDNLAQMIRG